MNKYSLTFKDEEYEEKEYRKQCHSDTSTIVKRILFIILFVSISMMINQLLATQEYKLIMVPFFNVIFFGIYKFGQKKEIVLDYFLIFIQLVLLKLIFFLSQVNILKNDTFE